MKVICDRAALLSAINAVSRAVPSRSPRPQLQCIKLSAVKPAKGGGELVVSGTDLEVAIRLSISQVEVNTPGEALIPSDKLRQIVSAEDNEPTLTLEVAGDHVTIRGADATFKLNTYPVADFPPLASYAETVAQTSAAPRTRTNFTIAAGALRTLADRTLFATAKEQSRYAINGVLMKRDGKKLTMVATDGKRLALCNGGLGAGSSKDEKSVSCIVPTKALQMLRDLVGDVDENVHVVLTDSQLIVAFGGDVTGKEPARATLSSNLVEGTFPPYEDVIPKEQDRRVTFDRDVLKSAVSRASLLTNEESRAVRMKFSNSGKQLHLSSRAAEMGEADIRCDIAKFEGDDIEIGFNPNYIVDALKVIPETEVIIELKAANKPGLVKAGADFVYVVMPLNLT